MGLDLVSDLFVVMPTLCTTSRCHFHVMLPTDSEIGRYLTAAYGEAVTPNANFR